MKKLVIFIFIALYLVACFSPLRLEQDSIRYFAIKDCIEGNCSDGKPAPGNFLPHGYPMLLSILSGADLLSAFSIAFINGIFLFFSLWLTKKIVAKSRPVLFYTLVLLNWTCIKLFAYALSEMQYLFFSTLSIYGFYRFAKNKDWKFLLMSFISCGLAIYTRTIGVTLLAALVIGLGWEYRSVINKATYLIACVVAAALAVAAIWKFPGLSHYVKALFIRAPNDPEIFNQVGFHSNELGQLFLNTPIGKAQSYLPPVFFVLAGILLLLWLVFAVVRCRKDIPAVVIIYLLIYTLVIFKWPHTDPRFWVPVLPFMAASILKAPLPAWKGWKIITPVAFSAYILMGIVAFGYSFYTQFNKEAFARTQANGLYREEYEIHFFGKSPTDTARPEVLRILKTYD